MDMLNSPLSSSLVEDEMVWTRPSSPESRYSQFKNQFKKYPVKFWARHISPENLLKPRNRSDFPTLVYSLVTPHFTFEEIFDMFPGPGPRPCNITGTPDVEKEEYSRDSPEFVAEEDRNVHEEDNTFTDDPEALAFYKSYEKHIAAITTRPTDQLPLGICVGEISSNTRFDIIPAPDHIHGGWQWKDSPHVLSFKNMLADEPRVPYPARSSRWRANASGGLDIPPPEEYEEEVYGPFEILNSFLDELIPRHEATPSDGFKDPSWIIKFIIFPNPSDGFRSEYDAEDWYNLTRGRVLPERFRRDFPSKQHWSDEEWYPAISLGVSQEAIDIQPGIILRISEFCKVFEVSMVCLPLLRPRKME
ncbi:hypothetical protein DFH27DRAFT_610363 [Peziza echinospora]|nr:hypothetical protein DFH27DRAFT_610363 [Peziza echinospora]